jgi:Phosphatidylserine decarboxylase
VYTLSEIKKGEELGYFQFGGSSHCVVFRKGVIEHFSVIKGDELLVGQEIAVANKVTLRTLPIFFSNSAFM